MNGKPIRGAGFTIIELSLVLIVLGILAVALMPMIQLVHDDAMREQDEATLESARNALLGYVRINEGFPCVDAVGDQVSSGCDPTRTLDLLGVRATDSRRRTFAYDVNDTLTLAEIAACGNSLCTALANIVDPPFPPPAPPEPSVCASTNNNTGSTACLAAAPMALVLYTLIVVWFDRVGHRHVEFPERPWYQRKEEPSFADMLTTLRRLRWKNNYGDISPQRGLAKKLFDQITWILCLAG